MRSRTFSKRLLLGLIVLTCVSPGIQAADDFSHHYAENGDVRIHYAVAGTGPLLVFIHGFPDYWYTWHHQMKALKNQYRVVAIDTRGYNLSGSPSDQSDYDLDLLIEDVKAVIKAEKAERAYIIGHDWGGAIAWGFASRYPDATAGLVILNAPHPRALAREMKNNAQQQTAAEYAHQFKQPDSHESLTAEGLAEFVTKGDRRLAQYREAFERSSLKGMMNYYRQNYPPYVDEPDFADIQVSVLQLHGLNDEYILPESLNGTWQWIDARYTLITLPNAGHWSHWDAADSVTRILSDWLAGQ